MMHHVIVKTAVLCAGIMVITVSMEQCLSVPASVAYTPDGPLAGSQQPPRTGND